MHLSAIFSLLLTALWAASPVYSRPAAAASPGAGASKPLSARSTTDGEHLEPAVSLALQLRLRQHRELQECIEGQLGISLNPRSAHTIRRMEWNNAFHRCRSCPGWARDFMLAPGSIEYVWYRAPNDPVLSASSSSSSSSSAPPSDAGPAAFARAESKLRLGHWWSRTARGWERASSPFATQKAAAVGGGGRAAFSKGSRWHEAAQGEMRYGVPA
ncbi:MAG: hypothetical protein M1826_004135 [Phylliscum demangeonii]|nr:MAG: hypothetical protein M1826_004135 [Phylliscum demangeonii]